MEQVKLGTIVNVRGLKGEVKIYSSSSFSSIRYKKGSKVTLKNEFDSKELTVAHHGFSNPFDFVIFDEIDNVDDANKLRGYDVLVNVDTLPKLGKDIYYFYQLIGMKVIDQNNNELGVVKAIEDNTAHNILRIKTNDKDVLVPFVKAFILNVDVENKVIKINKMEGLI